ncbi:MAG: 3-oxoacyl-ACP synthase III family protein [Syntrophobacteraceae bacterium]
MAIFQYREIAVKGICAAVPKRAFNNITDAKHFSEKERNSIVKLTGISSRRIADENTCASDLCFACAESLLSHLVINRYEIDVLIFISQTPDYRMPATAIILQHRLGLSQTCAAFDVNLGCSGFVYGLNMAYSYAQQPTIRKVLLLNGETRTKAYSFKDKSTGLLFGDAGSACLVEKDDHAGVSYFTNNSDGSRAHFIHIKAGGYRYPSSIDTIKEHHYDDGSIRTDEQGIMDGTGIFEFAIEAIPNDLRTILHVSNSDILHMDYYVFHQANKFITDHIARKMKIPMDRMPYSIQKYGNTSSVSIPLTIASELSDKLSGSKKKLLCCGFGVGLSWGCAIIEVDNPYIGTILEI